VVGNGEIGQKVNSCYNLNRCSTEYIVSYVSCTSDDSPIQSITTTMVYAGIDLEVMYEADKQRFCAFLNQNGLFSISWGICQGLAHMHSLNLIHSDVSVKNVVLDDQFHPRLCDFGSVHELGTHS